MIQEKSGSEKPHDFFSHMLILGCQRHLLRYSVITANSAQDTVPMNWDDVIDRYKYVTVHTDAIDIDVSWVPCFAIE